MMKNLYLDVNVLVYFLDQQSRFHQKVNSLLCQTVDDNTELFISSLGIDEFLHTLKRKFYSQKIPKAELWKKLRHALKTILMLPNLKIVNPDTNIKKQLKVLGYMKKYNLSPRDVYHLFTVISNNIDYLATFDQDFAKVKEVEIVGVGGIV